MEEMCCIVTNVLLHMNKLGADLHLNLCTIEYELLRSTMGGTAESKWRKVEQL